MKKTLVVASVIAGLLIIGGGGYWIGKTQSSAGTASSPPASGPQATTKAGTSTTGALGSGLMVDAITVKSVRMAQGLTAVGSLRSDESVTIRPEVPGRISEIGFREGQRVAKGATLIRFDASVQRAELARDVFEYQRITAGQQAGLRQ